MMEHRFEKHNVQCLKRDLRQMQEREQTQEVRLSEDMPDVGSILFARGQCVLRSKEWMGDGISVSGGIMAWVMYAPADGSKPRTVEVWIPVQLKWTMPPTEREGSIRAALGLRSLDARSISARKLMVRAVVSAMAEAMEPWGAEVYTPAEPVEDVQLLRRTYPAVLPLEAGEKAFLVDETAPFPAGAPEVEKILSFKVVPKLTEGRVMGGKAVFRGEVRLHLLCDGSNGELFATELSIPFAQFSDLDRDYEGDATIVVTMALTNAEPELQEGGVLVKCGLVAQYLVQDRVMLAVAEDAYSPRRELKLQTQELELPMVLDSGVETVCTESTLTAEASRVVDVWSEAAHPKLRRAGDLTELEFSGTSGVLYLDKEGRLQGSSGTWSQVVERPAAESAQIMTELMDMTQPTAVVGEGQVTVRQELTVGTSAEAQQGITMVTGFEMGEEMAVDQAKPSVILRRPGGEALWELAKGCGSTVDAICQANGLTDEPLDERMLLIPVYR